MARSDENQRMDAIGIEREIFNTTGILEEIFTFTGGSAYYPNGIMDVSMRNANGTWSELSPTVYTILVGGTGIQMNPGKRVTANTKLRIVYSSPTKKVAGAISVALAPPTALTGGAVTLPGVLPTVALTDGVVIKADDANLGAVSVNGFILEAGESVPVAIDNANKVLVTGTAGDIVYYLGG